MQMLSFYENRGGKNLPPERKQALEGAKKILRAKEDQEATRSSAKKASGKKATRKSSATKSTAAKSSTRKSK
jgi:hypothetical protein